MQELNLMEMNEERVDLSESWVNKYLSGQRPYTHLLGQVWQRKFDREGGFTEQWTLNGIAANRLMRLMDHEKSTYTSNKKVILLDGTSMDVVVKRRFLALSGAPMLYVEFSDLGSKPGQKEAYEKSIDDIKYGITYQGVKYEYCVSSASQKRTLKGVFVREDYQYPEEYLSKFDLSIDGCAEYVETLRSLRGARAVLEAITFGAMSEEFMDGPTSVAKFMARAGLAGSSSESLGRDFRILRMGEVRFEWTEYIEREYLSLMTEDFRGNKVPVYTKDDVEGIKRMWKETKLDGESIIRASAATRALKKLGYKVKYEDVVGAFLTFRANGGIKGGAVVIADHILDMVRDRDGKKIYEDYDLIVENNSWKYTPSRFYTGDLAPEFELVNISKPKFTSFMNYQAWMALDGDMGNMDVLVDVAKKAVDKSIENIKNTLLDPEAAKIRFGLVDTAYSPLNEIGVDAYEMNMNNKVTKALSACPEVVYDKWFRRKVLYLLAKTEDDVKTGKVEVEGANRYGMTDPIPLLRADLGVINPKTGLMDIVITDPSQVALPGIKDAYWAKKEQEVVIFRMPCIHPGEPQRMNLRSAVPETIETAFGLLPVREIYDSIKDVLVLSGFSNALDAMGGADADGDTFHIVTYPSIVRMRDGRRKTILVEIESETMKEDLTMDSIRDDMVRSLRNNWIGLITDYATTWRDIQMTVAREKRVRPEISKGLIQMKKAAQNNLSSMAPWVLEDPSIEKIAAMDPDDWKSVYQAGNAALRELRMLQEMSINTAKTGIFVEFGSKDPDRNNYNHLSIGIRASWHRPGAKKQYKSESTMAHICEHITREWKKLEEWADETAAPLMPGVKAKFGPDYMDVFESVNKMRSEYGERVYALTLKKLPKEEFNLYFEDIASEYNSMLTVLSAKYGVDMVAVAAYDASNKDSRKKGADGTSFVWNCFFDELLQTMKFLSAGDGESRLHRIFLDPVYNYRLFKEGGPCTVYGGVALLAGHRIGRSKLDDGTYDCVVIDGVPFIKVDMPRSSLEELTAKLSGIKFAIIGIGQNTDKSTGEPLTRDGLIGHIESPLNKGIIITKAIMLKSDPTPRVGVYLRYSETGRMLVGVIPFEDKVLSNALDMKAFRVKIAGKKEAESRLTVEILEMVRDLL